MQSQPLCATHNDGESEGFVGSRGVRRHPANGCECKQPGQSTGREVSLDVQSFFFFCWPTGSM